MLNPKSTLLTHTVMRVVNVAISFTADSVLPDARKEFNEAMSLFGSIIRDVLANKNIPHRESFSFNFSSFCLTVFSCEPLDADQLQFLLSSDRVITAIKSNQHMQRAAESSSIKNVTKRKKNATGSVW